MQNQFLELIGINSAASLKGAQVTSDSRLDSWLDFKSQLFEHLGKYLEQRGVEAFYAQTSLLHIVCDTKEIQTLQCRHFSGEFDASTKDIIFSDRALCMLVSSAFKNQSVVELGCRAGAYLKFIKEHGASCVQGVTGQQYAVNARVALGADAVIVANVTELTPRQLTLLRKNRPKIVISTNLLDASREGAGFEQTYKFIDKLLSLGALNYIVPALNQRSMLTSFDFVQMDLMGGSMQGIEIGKHTYQQIRDFNMLPPADMPHLEVEGLNQSSESRILGCSYRFRITGFGAEENYLHFSHLYSHRTKLSN